MIQQVILAARRSAAEAKLLLSRTKVWMQSGGKWILLGAAGWLLTAVLTYLQTIGNILQVPAK